MTQARKALIIAPDDVHWEFDDYAAACRALNLEPNGHCYVVCRVSTAVGPRTLLTADLGLLQDAEKADTSDQARDRPALGRLEPAGPAPPPPTRCERELKAEKEENAGLRGKLKRLEKRVAELEGQLEVAKRPYLRPPAGPLRPYYGEGPWDKGPGGPGPGP
jgi:hypothetical protein